MHQKTVIIPNVIDLGPEANGARVYAITDKAESHNNNGLLDQAPKLQMCLSNIGVPGRLRYHFFYDTDC